MSGGEAMGGGGRLGLGRRQGMVGGREEGFVWDEDGEIGVDR